MQTYKRTWRLLGRQIMGETENKRGKQHRVSRKKYSPQETDLLNKLFILCNNISMTLGQDCCMAARGRHLKTPFCRGGSFLPLFVVLHLFCTTT